MARGHGGRGHRLRGIRGDARSARSPGSVRACAAPHGGGSCRRDCLGRLRAHGAGQRGSPGDSGARRGISGAPPARRGSHSPTPAGSLPVTGRVVALCGGVGGAKLAQGLGMALAPGELSIIVNTGDDFQHLGLCISPDLDSVMYALAGLSDPVRGWGRRNETWTFMKALEALGGESWFQLGDGDLAMHVERTWRLAHGATLSDVTAHLCRALGIAVRVLPMSDDPVRTRVLTEEGWLDFQEYFVHRQCRPAVREFTFAGADTARAQPEALAALERRDLRAIIICPSN